MDQIQAYYCDSISLEEHRSVPAKVPVEIVIPSAFHSQKNLMQPYSNLQGYLLCIIFFLTIRNIMESFMGMEAFVTWRRLTEGFNQRIQLLCGPKVTLRKADFTLISQPPSAF